MSVLGKILYGLQVAAIGLVVVFTGLAILIGCVLIMGAVFRKITARREEKAKAAAEAARAAPEAEAKKAAATVPAEPAPSAPAAEEVTDPQLIAVIAAAIAAFSDANKPLVVRSVRRVSGWNRASRAEQVYRF